MANTVKDKDVVDKQEKETTAKKTQTTKTVNATKTVDATKASVNADKKSTSKTNSSTKAKATAKSVDKPKVESKDKEVKKGVVDTEVFKDTDGVQPKDKKTESAQKKANKKEPRIMSKEEVDIKFKKEQAKAKRKRRKNLDLSYAERFDVDVKVGLDQEQITSRVKQGYFNKVESKGAKTYFSIFMVNIFTFFNLLCMGVAAALIYVGAWSQLVFMAVMFANMGIGILQEIRAKKTIEKIKLVNAPTATVIRESFSREVNVSDVVLDDILVYETGKQICTDCIVVQGDVEVNESLLTGESIAIKKKVGDMLLAGSFVVAGRCFAKAEKVGRFNYTSQLTAQAKQFKKPKSELLRTLSFIIKCIAVIILPLAILMFLNNWKSTGGSLDASILATSGSIIGMIPSGMFLLTSMALAVGVVKLAKKRTLVQDLYSIEMLARTDVLCLDKTGTITDGSMKVHSVIDLQTKGDRDIKHIVGSMLTSLEDNNSTSRALSKHFGYSKEYLSKEILPFSSARKLSAVTFLNGKTFAYGAPEFISKVKNPEVDRKIREFVKRGFRVLMLAEVSDGFKDEKLGVKREPIALIVIEDNIRPEAEETLKWFRDNNVTVKIISGDNAITVSEISKRVGVVGADNFISLEGLSDKQVVEAASRYTVFGRVSPEQKRILVRALRNKGHKVAMTGDGVNDILALKEADCSIAMAGGSEAARNVSNLVLLDSNFASMPSVVAEGRRVINNIQKSSSLFLMKTFFTILLTVFFLIIGQTYPFSPTHIYLLEMAVIGVAAFFLSLQPNKDKIKGKFLSALIINALPGAIVFTLNVIAVYLFDVILGTSGQWVTMGSILVTFAGILVLFNLCQPFDMYRSFMFTGVLAICALALAFVPWSFFGYQSLDLQNILFIMVLAQASYPLYAYVVKWCSYINFGKE